MILIFGNDKKLVPTLSMLLFHSLVMTACTKYTVVEDSYDEIKVPVYEVSRDRLNEMHNISVLDLLILLKYQVPMPKIGTEYDKVLRRIKQSQAKIYKKQGSLIVAEILKKTSDTGKADSYMRLEYHFENQLLIKGPIIVNL